MNDNLAEHLAAFHTLKSLLEIRKVYFGVDYRQETICHLGEAVANVAHGGAERAKNLILLLEQHHQIHRRRRARGRAAGDEASAALEREQGSLPGFRADMLEHNVYALLGGELANHAFETVGAVVD